MMLRILKLAEMFTDEHCCFYFIFTVMLAQIPSRKQLFSGKTHDPAELDYLENLEIEEPEMSYTESLAPQVKQIRQAHASYTPSTYQ